MHSTSTGAAAEKAPEPEQHFHRRVLWSRSSIFINDSSGAGAEAASDLWLLRSPGKIYACSTPVHQKPSENN